MEALQNVSIHARTRLLVVGDDEETRSFFQEVVAQTGFRVTMVPDAQAAMRRIETEKIDVVFTDVVTDDLSSYALIGSAVSSPSRPEVIATVDREGLERATRALQYGAFDCIVRPFRRDRFYLSLRRVLEYRRLKMQLAHLTGKNDSSQTRGVGKALRLYDAATGLPNRTLLFDRLEQAIVRERTRGGYVILIVIGVDHLKESTGGEDTPRVDALLSSISADLRRELFDRDTVARIGASRIAVLAEVNDANTTYVVADKVNGVLTMERKLDAEGRSLKGANAGIAMFPTDGDTAQAVHEKAIAALRMQQRRGAAGYRFYHSRVSNRAARSHTVLERRLEDAVASNGFALVLQPYHRLTDAAPCGGEALLRWTDDVLGEVPPHVFVPALEKSRLIVPVTEWIVDTLAALQKELIRLKLDGYYLSFNVSPVQLQHPSESSKLIDTISQKLEKYDNIVVEITGNVPMSRAESTTHVLKRLKEIGVKVAIDDFGAGYSSLSHLMQFEFDLIKVDRTFVGKTDGDVKGKPIVSAIISMARELGIVTVAEGVETMSHKTVLRHFGCDLAQGYYYSKPIPIRETVNYFSGCGECGTMLSVV
ncbi:MAG: EAL domain-containing protein [Spirochaetales bacterium]|nr:EAL domain-containing protein [Spirochaetales bacterium]